MLTKETAHKPPEDLQLRQIGRGYIVCRENTLMGYRLTHGYLDQHDKMYVLVNNVFEPLGSNRRFLVVA